MELKERCYLTAAIIPANNATRWIPRIEGDYFKVMGLPFIKRFSS